MAVDARGVVQMSLSDQLGPMRRSILAAIGVCCLVALAGCGGGEEPATSDAGTSGDSSPAATPEMPVPDAMPVVDAAPKSAGKHDADETDAPPPVATEIIAPPVAPPGGFRIRSGDIDDSGAPPLLGGIPVGSIQQAAQLPAKSARPDSFDAWTDEDFLSAAREHDPRILDAIDFKVKSAPGDAGVAVLLTTLLDPSATPVQTKADGTPPSPAPAGAAPGSIATPAPSITPQSSLRKSIDRNHNSGVMELPSAVDSVTAMILEAAVTYMPQGAGVSAIAGGVPGRIEDLSGPASGGRSRKKREDQNDDLPDQNVEGTTPSGYPAGGNALGANTPPGGGQLTDRALVERVVDGLIANNSQDAWQSVFGIVAGTVKTPLPAVMNCEIVVERLMQNMDSNPNVIQPVMMAFLDNATPIPPESRIACMRMLAAVSATQMDKLTGFGETALLPAANPGGISGVSGVATGSGLPARPIFRLRRGGDDEDDSGMTPVAISPVGINALGGNAAVTATSLLPKVTMEPEVVAKGASFLWSPKAVAAIVNQLEKATDLSTASDVILLASTIPVAEVRQAICSAFLRLYPSGSDGLKGSGLFADVHDPGMLVILKSLPRTRPLKETPGIMDSWTSATESLVLVLRDELRRNSGSMIQHTDTLPVKLHKNATAEVSVMMQFPGGPSEPAKDAIPAATQVYYTRTTFTPQKKRDIEDLTNHYEGRTSGYSRPDQAKGLWWIEGVRALPNGHRRTMDVVIQTGGANGQTGFSENAVGGGVGGTFIIEIIVVDTVDPKAASPAEATQTSAGP